MKAPENDGERNAPLFRHSRERGNNGPKGQCRNVKGVF
jgi:hypothetical protein